MHSLTGTIRTASAFRTKCRQLAGIGSGCVLALQLVLAAPAAAQTPAPPQPGDPVVARVDGQDIRASDLAIVEEDIGANLPQKMAGEGKRDYLTTFTTDMLLVAKAAEARKIPDGDDFKRRLAYFRNKLLMELLLQAEAKASITDAALHKVYDDATKQMTTEKEVRARHILVESEDDAKAILGELKKGADFEQLAKQKSKDSGANGGDLGYFTKDQMVPEFSEVAFRLEKGQLSDPVKSQFGWHIIKVEDKRDRSIPEFDKVKDQLESYVSRKAQADLVGKLRADAKIERLEQPAPGPAAPAAEPKK
jgi:peptidyl-prolyl cis-trans isomerase C